MDQFDPRRAGLAYVASLDFPAVNCQRAGHGLDDSGHDASEGRLAGAILPYHRVDQYWGEGEAYRDERSDLAVMDGNIPALECGNRRRFSDLLAHDPFSPSRPIRPLGRPGLPMPQIALCIAVVPRRAVQVRPAAHRLLTIGC
jgi:hypothetical protein